MKNLFKALASFQQEVPIIHKGTEGYGYSYADLPAILPIINPILAKHGLGFTQLGTGTGIKTIIFHSESGETLESLFDIPQGVSLAKMNDFQVLGSAITYMRRYALSSALGLVTDKDTDAGGEQGKQSPTKKQYQDDDNIPKVWLTEGQFKNAIALGQQKDTLLYFDGKTVRKDSNGNDVKFIMKKEYRTELTNSLNN